MKKLLRYVVEMIIAIAIVYCLNRVYDLYEKSKLSDRPFDPAVWGNAADWVLIFCTIISIGFIAYTLKTQFKALDLQFEAYRIEKEKYIKTIEPNFELDIKYMESSEIDGVYSIVIKALENTVKKINCEIKLNGDLDENPIVQNHNCDLLYKGETAIIPDIQFECFISDNQRKMVFFDVCIKFQDTENTMYSKSFSCICEEHNIKVIAQNTILVSLLN